MLKHPFKVFAAKDKTRVNIEKQSNKAVKASYLALNTINQKYDELTSDAELAFERFEHEYNQTIQAIELTFEKKRADNTEHYKEAEAKYTERQKNLHASHKETIEAIKLDGKKSLILIENELNQLDQEQNLTLKEIEKNHLNNRSIFQDKLERFKKNHAKNAAKTKQSFHDIIEQMQKDSSKLEDDDHPLKQLSHRFDDDLKNIHTKISNALNEETTNFKKTLGELASSISNDFLTVDERTYALLETFNTPFSSLHQKALSFINQTNQILYANDAIIETDYQFESTTINRQIKGTKELPTDPRDIKDLRARLKLFALRKETLLTQNDHLRHLFGELASNIESLFKDDQVFFEKTLKTYHALIMQFKTRVDELFNVIETQCSQATKHTDSLQKNLDAHGIIDTLQSQIPNLLSALVDFEKQRLTAHIDYAKALLTLITTFDDIHLYLDTVEASKEIETNRQKLENALEDTQLRFAMRKHKFDREKVKAEITIQTLIDEQSLLHQTTLAKETQTKEESILNFKHQKYIMEIDEKIEASHTLNILRRNHIEHDLTTNEARYQLEKEKLSNEHRIKQLITQKEFDLSLNDVQRTFEEKRLRIDFEIKQTQDTLALTATRKTETENQLAKSFNDKKTRIIEEHLLKKNELNRTMTALDKEHQAKMAFIDRALEKETAAPKQHIEEISQLIKQKSTLIKTNLDNVSKPLIETKKALSNPDESIKPLLFIISSGFVKLLSNAIDDGFNQLGESHRFVSDIILKHLENETATTRKKQNTIDKHQQDLQKTLQKNKKQQQLFKNQIITRIEAANALIKQDTNPKYQAIVQIIKPLYDMISEQVPIEVKRLLKEIHDLYAQLYAGDQELIDRAKKNHQKAHALEIKRYEESLEAMQSTIDASQSQLDEALNHLESSQTDDKEKTLKPYTIQEETLQNQMQLYEEQRKHLEEESLEKERVLNESYKTSTRSLQSEYSDAKGRLDNQHRQRIEKLNTRLIDFNNMLEYEKNNATNQIIQHEQILHDSLRKTQETYDLIKHKNTQVLSEIKENKELQIADEEVRFNQLSQTYEDKVLSSAVRLETSIEKALRNIDQDVLLKEQKLTHLQSEIKSLESSFIQSKAVALKTLHAEIEAMLEGSSDLISQPLKQLEIIEKNHQAWLDDLIAFILSDLS